MAIHKGKYIILYLSGSEVGFQDSCSLQANKEMIELAATSDGSRRYLPNKQDYSISCSGLMGIENGSIAGKSLLTALKNGTSMSFKIEFETTGEEITGTCYCDSWSNGADATGYGTYSANLVITGDINIS